MRRKKEHLVCQHLEKISRKDAKGNSPQLGTALVEKSAGHIKKLRPVS